MRASPNSPRRRQRVEIETDRHLIVGEVTLPPEGYQSRLSDALNRSDVTFLPLTNAVISPLGGGESERRPFIALGKRHIRLAYPLED